MSLVKKSGNMPNLGFVFKLFFENTLYPFYKNTITNKLSGAAIDLTPPLKEVPNGLVVPDIPDYLRVNLATRDGNIGQKRVMQYKGYLANLMGCPNVDSYMALQLSARNRKNLRSKIKKMESTHQISYEFHYGKIEKKLYDYLFDEFYKLLETRFTEKKVYNKNLIYWKYYHELSYPLILDKKAVLFVIYDNGKPIDLTLNFLLNDMAFSFIQGYDIAYSNYNLGDISMVKHIDWCISNQISVFDLSMGETDYKIKWCNYEYPFFYDIFYNKKSLTSVVKTYITVKKLELKQYLRDRNIIGKLFQYDRFFYKSRVKKLKNYNWKET